MLGYDCRSLLPFMTSLCILLPLAFPSYCKGDEVGTRRQQVKYKVKEAKTNNLQTLYKKSIELYKVGEYKKSLYVLKYLSQQKISEKGRKKLNKVIGYNYCKLAKKCKNSDIKEDFYKKSFRYLSNTNIKYGAQFINSCFKSKQYMRVFRNIISCSDKEIEKIKSLLPNSEIKNFIDFTRDKNLHETLEMFSKIKRNTGKFTGEELFSIAQMRKNNYWLAKAIVNQDIINKTTYPDVVFLRTMSGLSRDNEVKELLSLAKFSVDLAMCPDNIVKVIPSINEEMKSNMWKYEYKNSIEFIKNTTSDFLELFFKNPTFDDLKYSVFLGSNKMLKLALQYAGSNMGLHDLYSGTPFSNEKMYYGDYGFDAANVNFKKYFENVTVENIISLKNAGFSKIDDLGSLVYLCNVIKQNKYKFTVDDIALQNKLGICRFERYNPVTKREILKNLRNVKERRALYFTATDETKMHMVDDCLREVYDYVEEYKKNHGQDRGKQTRVINELGMSSHAPLPQLLKHYTIGVYEVSNIDQIKKKAKEFCREYGKSDLVVIAGHGTNSSIQMSSMYVKYGNDNLNPFGKEINENNVHELNGLKKYLEKKPTIVLASCSTAKKYQDSIAGAIHKHVTKPLGGKLYAPDNFVSYAMEFVFDKNKELRNIIYEPYNTIEFSNDLVRRSQIGFKRKGVDYEKMIENFTRLR